MRKGLSRRGFLAGVVVAPVVAKIPAPTAAVPLEAPANYDHSGAEYIRADNALGPRTIADRGMTFSTSHVLTLVSPVLGNKR